MTLSPLPVDPNKEGPDYESGVLVGVILSDDWPNDPEPIYDGDNIYISIDWVLDHEYKRGVCTCIAYNDGAVITWSVKYDR